MTYLPTPEQVAVAWLKTVAGVPADKVATSLPADATAWGATGFVQVTVVGGSPEADVPLFRPVVAVDCWATNPGSSKPPWGRAGSLAAVVVWGTYSFRGMVVDAGPDFYPAPLLSVRPISQPRRIPDVDETGYARVQLDVELAWTVAAGVPA